MLVMARCVEDFDIFEKNVLYNIDINYYVCNGHSTWFGFNSKGLEHHYENNKPGQRISANMNKFEILETQ